MIDVIDVIEKIKTGASDVNNKGRGIELLAPAGSTESLRMAIASGADAVYLGYTAFGARAGANNFDFDQLKEAIGLCHLYHKKVYATVNTLIKQSELSECIEIAHRLSEMHIDALIVQDIGAAMSIRRQIPEICLHGSTQMSIHNQQGAQLLIQNGFDRVVAARECPFGEIQKIINTGIETEVFVHGAMCVSVSGQCLFSSMVGGRSGNRGRCAQPCRQTYSYNNSQQYWLSPKDLMLYDHLEKLIQMGVHSLKIEGRLKRPEYVQIVTAAYRKAIDLLSDNINISIRRTDNDPIAREKLQRELMQIYHRGGFTHGYGPREQKGPGTGDVIDTSRGSHGGILLGHIERVHNQLAYINLLEDIHPEDGLQFRGKNNEWDTTYSGTHVPAGGRAIVRLREEMRPNPKDAVYKLWDSEQLRQSQNTAMPKISVQSQLKVIPGEISELLMETQGAKAIAKGPVAQRGEKVCITKESAKSAIGKLKETPFELKNITVIGEGGYLPVSALNQMRREAVMGLNKLIIKQFEDEQSNKAIENGGMARAFQQGGASTIQKNSLIVQSSDATLASKILAAGADIFVYMPEDISIEALKTQLETQIAYLKKGCWLGLPVQISSDTLKKICDLANNHKDNLGGVVLGSIGQLGAGWALPLAGGYGIPLWNDKTAGFLNQYGLVWQTISPELNESEIKAIYDHCDDQIKGRLALPIYGRTRLMVLNHCIERIKLEQEGQGQHPGAECHMCKKKSKSLTDKMGYVFPIRPIHSPEGCTEILFNSLPTNLDKYINKSQGRNNFEFRDFHWVLDFTIESGEEQISLTRHFREMRDGMTESGTSQGESGNAAYTAGHFRRGVW